MQRDNPRIAISIHAPSRERPKYKFGTSMITKISIHAPSRERLKSVVEQKNYSTFQSTLPHGSDETAAGIQDIADISIHAPSRERRWFVTIH